MCVLYMNKSPIVNLWEISLASTFQSLLHFNEVTLKGHINIKNACVGHYQQELIMREAHYKLLLPEYPQLSQHDVWLS